MDLLTPFNHPIGAGLEFACHGLGWRLSLMKRCVEKVFELLPPESEEVPDPNALHDLTVCLQAVVLNTYGCLDNLAHIWVLGKNLRGKWS